MRLRELVTFKVLGLCLLSAVLWAQSTVPEGGPGRFGLLSRTVKYYGGDGVMLATVRVPAGEFEMGSPEKEFCHNKDEGPIRRVTITRGFEMSQTEITREVFGKVMGWSPWLGGLPDWPVTSVDWEDCILFCNRLSELFGFEKCYNGWGKDVVCDFGANGFRLPTEAEWEYACRAGTTSAYHCGDEAYGQCQQGQPGSADVAKATMAKSAYLECVAWFSNNSNHRIHRVAQKEPNAFGLYDMHGNVWEWCWDLYDPDFYSCPDAVDPAGAEKGASRVVRGGSYLDYREDCRSARREYVWPGHSHRTLGFRVVRSID